MEDIYFGMFQNRQWCGDKIHLKRYFEKYSNEISPISNIKNKPNSEIDICQLFFTESNKPSNEELLALQVECSGEGLTELDENDIIKKKCIRSKDNETVTSDNKEECKEILEEEISLSTYKNNRVRYNKTTAVRTDVTLDDAERSRWRDLEPNVDFKVFFRIQEPYVHVVGDKSRPGRCTQEIAVLNENLLTELRDSIICEADFQDVRGDISENPDSPIKDRTQDRYHSNMFYFDNTFYVDKRNEDNLDYSEPIRKWALSKGIKLGQSVEMESIKVEDLIVRMGYPYLYMHQGYCEHIVCISDASLLSTKDNLNSQEYPMHTKTSHKNMLYCMLCARLPAKWVVFDCKRLAHNPTYECRKCFKYYHYINGNKVGEFKACQYSQRSILL